MTVKEVIAYCILALIVTSYIASEYIDTTAEHDFFTDMREHHADAAEILHDVEDFISRGGRNTAKQGYELCLRVAALEKQHEAQAQESCEEIYGATK